MRLDANRERIERFMRELAKEATRFSRVYFTGGVTAVLHGWRPDTLDIDLKLMPDNDELLRALPRLKNELQINVELAAPDQFIPEVPGWQDRSVFIEQIGKLGFYHYDLYSQALAKLERQHAKDLLDIEAVVERGLVQRDELLRLFERIEGDLFRYPAIDAEEFRKQVETFVSAET